MIGQDIVCVSTQDFDDLWTRKQRWVFRLAKRNRVLYVESQVHWITALRQWPLHRKRLWSSGMRMRQEAPGLWIWTPPILWPFFQMSRPINWVNNRRLARLLRRQVAQLGFTDPILWLYTPYSSDLIEPLKPKCTIYECVDDFAAARGLIRSSVVRRLEDETFRRADLTVLTAPSLAETAARQTQRWRISPNACDVEFFASASHPDEPSHPLMGDLPRPVFGFVGAVAYWVDCDLLAHLARSRPDATVVVVGPVRVNVGNYEHLPNLIFAGRRPYEQLPAIMRGFDVCLNPYKVDDVARGASPLKLYEYLATGKPIVSTVMPEAERFADVVRIAGNREEFVAACDAAVREPEAERRRREERQRDITRSQTWEARFDELERWVDELLDSRPGTGTDVGRRDCRIVMRRPPEGGLVGHRSGHVVINALSITGPRLAGGFRYLTSLLRPLIESHPESHFTLIVGRSAARYFDWRLGNLSLVRMPDLLTRGPMRSVFERFRMSALLDRLRADVYFLPYGLMPIRQACPQVMTFQNLYFFHAAEFAEWQAATLWGRWYERVRLAAMVRGLKGAVDAADYVIAVSQTAVSELSERLAVPPGKICVVPEGVGEPFAPSEAEDVDVCIREHLGLPDRYFLSVGAIAPNKNLHLLLAAYAKLREMDSECAPLVLAGPDWRRFSRRILARARRLGIADRLTFTGLVDAATLAAIYRGAIATVQLSTCESFGLPALEAMACCCPLVVANRSGLPEVAGGSAITVDADDGDGIADLLHRLGHDDDLRTSWIRRGITRAAEFNWPEAAERTYAVIARAAGWGDREIRPRQPVRVAGRRHKPHAFSQAGV